VRRCEASERLCERTRNGKPCAVRTVASVISLGWHPLSCGTTPLGVSRSLPPPFADPRPQRLPVVAPSLELKLKRTALLVDNRPFTTNRTQHERIPPCASASTRSAVRFNFREGRCDTGRQIGRAHV